MAREPEDAVFRILQQIQATLAERGRKIGDHTKQFDQVNVQITDIRESIVTALGLSAHAKVRHDNVQKQIEELRYRLERLEEKV